MASGDRTWYFLLLYCKCSSTLIHELRECHLRVYYTGIFYSRRVFPLTVVSEVCISLHWSCSSQVEHQGSQWVVVIFGDMQWCLLLYLIHQVCWCGWYHVNGISLSQNWFPLGFWRGVCWIISSHIDTLVRGKGAIIPLYRSSLGWTIQSILWQGCNCILTLHHR